MTPTTDLSTVHLFARNAQTGDEMMFVILIAKDGNRLEQAAVQLPAMAERLRSDLGNVPWGDCEWRCTTR